PGAPLTPPARPPRAPLGPNSARRAGAPPAVFPRPQENASRPPSPAKAARASAGRGLPSPRLRGEVTEFAASAAKNSADIARIQGRPGVSTKQTRDGLSRCG